MEKKPILKQEIKKERKFDPGFSTKQFDFPSQVKTYLETNGLEGRFVNIKQMGKFGGVHPRGWQPIKIPTELLSGVLGADPEGYYRKGDLVLAAKKKEQVEDHREYLRQEAARHNVNDVVKKRKYEEFKNMVKDSGLQDIIKVHTGYED